VAAELLPCPWLPRKDWRVLRKKACGGRPPKVTDEQLLALITRGQKHRASRIRKEAMSLYKITRTTALTRLGVLVKAGLLKKTFNQDGLSFLETK
jgi:hypothetical protein